jgi:hypothetical protein
MTDHNKNTTGPISKKQLLAFAPPVRKIQVGLLSIRMESSSENRKTSKRSFKT